MDSKRLNQWLEAFRDGTLTEAEAEQLARLLREDEQALAQFREDLAFTNLLGHLTDDMISDDDFSRAFWERIQAEDSTQEFSRRFCEKRRQIPSPTEPAAEAEQWQSLARAREHEIEKRAQEALERFKAEERERAEALAYKAYLSQRRRLLVGAGALVMLFAILLLALLAPKPKPDESTVVHSSVPITPAPVATIIRSVDAQWDRQAYSVSKGTRLTASSMLLQKGFVEIAFDEGAEVILQAPCALRLNDAGSMYLTQGIISAFVPEHALGFKVETAAGVITDYGTEFGVVAHENGETETHVYKGKVELASPRTAASSGYTEMLTKGQAGAIAATGAIKRKPFNLTRFVYSLKHATRFGVPGKRLNLADIVGGGNGFGTGTLERGINPLNGMPYTNKIQTLGLKSHQGTTRYWPVPENPFVDGVFTPDNENGEIQVSTEGHTFAGFPNTCRAFYGGITNGSYHESDTGNERVPKTYLRLAGKDYGIENPSIYLCSNQGITFDLQAIRTAMPCVTILRFTALCGITESIRIYTQDEYRTDFWVLVDGRDVYMKQGVTVNSPVQSLDIELQPTDRFLTLATTDGGDRSSNDWAIFAEPVLELAAEAGP